MTRLQTAGALISGNHSYADAGQRRGARTIARYERRPPKGPGSQAEKANPKLPDSMFRKILYMPRSNSGKPTLIEGDSCDG